MRRAEGAYSYSQALKGEQHVPLCDDTDETNLHLLATEPSCDTAALEVKKQVEQHPPVPDLYDLQQQLGEAGPCFDTGSTSSGSETCSQKSKIIGASNSSATARLEEKGCGLLTRTCTATMSRAEGTYSYSEALKGERCVSLHGGTDETNLHPLDIEPRCDTTVREVKKQVEHHPPVADFFDLQRQLERVAPFSDTTLTSSSEAFSQRSKSKAQIVKIVQMVKKRLPEYEEQEIHRHVVDLRRSQGGFSHMKLNAIVALVLSHMRNIAYDAASTVKPAS